MTDANPGNRTPNSKDTSRNLLDTLQTAFLVAMAFGIFYALKGNAKSDAQAMFRIGVLTVGTVGLIAIRAIKWRSGQSS